MQQLPGSQYRVQFGIGGWAKIVAGLAIFVALIAFLAVGFLFVVLPMIVLAPIIYWFMPKRKVFFVGSPWATGPTNDAKQSAPGDIIDGEFRVIEELTKREQSVGPDE